MAPYKGFSQVELRKPERSLFDISHEKRLSTRMGKLTPVFFTECLPNDTFRVSSEVLVKLAPMLAPIYHRCNVYVHYFFVPNRLLWKDWETFITGGRLGAAVAAPPVPPRVNVDTLLGDGKSLLDKGSLADYLGVPNVEDSQAGYSDVWLDQMPAAVYYKVWYDYYRDRNFVDDNEALPMATGGPGPDYGSIWQIRYRCWEHDYFTSALPFTQRGAEVLMPLAGTGTITNGRTGDIRNVAGGGLAGTGNLHSTAGVEDIGGTAVYHDVDGDVELSTSDVSINDFRRAVALQSWLERNALAGSRYNEAIYAHFNRRTSDARLQRAEYLGGGKAILQISEVNTTSYSQDADDNLVPPGYPSGRGSGYANTNSFTYNCEEHGFVIGLMSVMPTSGYMQGIPRYFFQRHTQLDYPFPSFAHLGEQEVYDAEIYWNPDTAVPVDGELPVFGYQSRYVDWKQIPSSSHGDFRTSLDFWHLTRKFGDVPTLDGTFVTFEDGLQDRIFAVAEADTLWCYVYNKATVKRSLPYFGTPQIRG